MNNKDELLSIKITFNDKHYDFTTTDFITLEKLKEIIINNFNLPKNSGDLMKFTLYKKIIIASNDDLIDNIDISNPEDSKIELNLSILQEKGIQKIIINSSNNKELKTINQNIAKDRNIDIKNIMNKDLSSFIENSEFENYINKLKDIIRVISEKNNKLKSEQLEIKIKDLNKKIETLEKENKDLKENLNNLKKEITNLEIKIKNKEILYQNGNSTSSKDNQSNNSNIEEKNTNKNINNQSQEESEKKNKIENNINKENGQNNKEIKNNSIKNELRILKNENALLTPKGDESFKNETKKKNGEKDDIKNKNNILQQETNQAILNNESKENNYINNNNQKNDSITTYKDKKKAYINNINLKDNLNKVNNIAKENEENNELNDSNLQKRRLSLQTKSIKKIDEDSENMCKTEIIDIKKINEIRKDYPELKEYSDEKINEKLEENDGDIMRAVTELMLGVTKYLK